MSGTFTKGYTFAPTETPKDATLDTFIQSSTIAGIDREEMDAALSLISRKNPYGGSGTFGPPPLFLGEHTINAGEAFLRDQGKWIPVRAGTSFTLSGGTAAAQGSILRLGTADNTVQVITAVSHTLGVAFNAATVGSLVSVLTEGLVRLLVNSAAVRGDFLYPTTTAGVATTVATIQESAFGLLLEAPPTGAAALRWGLLWGHTMLK